MRLSSVNRIVATLWPRDASKPSFPSKSVGYGNWDIIRTQGNSRLLKRSLGIAKSSGTSVLFQNRIWLICTYDPRSTSKYGLFSNCVCAKALISFPSMLPSTPLHADYMIGITHTYQIWDYISNIREFFWATYLTSHPCPCTGSSNGLADLKRGFWELHRAWIIQTKHRTEYEGKN